MAGPTRRRVLAALGLAPLLAGCGLLDRGDSPPDPLIALADAARADAAAADTLAAAEPELAERLGPLAAARREHAAALDAEVTRLDPDREPAPTTAPSPSAASPSPAARPSLTTLVAALTAAGSAAADVALSVPVERVGLVGAVSACCSAYAALLEAP